LRAVFIQKRRWLIAATIYQIFEYLEVFGILAGRTAIGALYSAGVIYPVPTPHPAPMPIQLCGPARLRRAP
jgi:hypothetical protein